MEFRQLKTFLAVAERRSFTRAARDLNLAQSSVSAQVRALEEDLGTQLFDRLGRSVILTEAGEKLVHFARRMARMGDQMRAELAGGEPQGGILTIRMPETIASEYMPGVVERFSAAHPLVELSFINCDDVQLREELDSGRIDVAFLLMESMDFGRVDVESLKAEPLALVAGTGHPLAGRTRVGSEELQGGTVLHLRVD